MNTAHKLQKYLSSVGVKKIFGIVGREGAAILFDETKTDIEFVLTRHELSAGMMAISQSKLTGNTPQVCFATLGPGATNLMTAIGSAYQDRHPLIAIVAQVERNSIIYGDVHQCIDPVSVAKPIT